MKIFLMTVSCVTIFDLMVGFETPFKPSMARIPLN